MAEHLTRNQIEDYCRRTLRPAELLSVTDHLGACEECRREIAGPLESDASFFALRSEVFGEAAETCPTAPSAHPNYEKIAEYTDGVLAGEALRIVEDHLTSCGQCAMEVKDLRVFRSQVAPDLGHEYRPAPVSTATASRRSARAGLLSFWL